MCQHHNPKDKALKYLKYAILPCVFAGLLLGLPDKAKAANVSCDDYLGAEVRLKIPAIAPIITEAFDRKDVCVFRVIYWTKERYLQLKMVDITIPKKEMKQ